MTIRSAAVADSLSVIGVALATIIPRPKFLLGVISQDPFRPLMCVVVGTNVIRSLFINYQRLQTVD